MKDAYSNPNVTETGARRDTTAFLPTTYRATSPAMEQIMNNPRDVLDHGFVRVVDYMGEDAAIVQAARVSYGMGTKGVRKDAALIDYLMRKRHTTPFEMCEVKLHVKLPIFVARQWIRHRMANVNEASARYSILDGEFYIPELDDLATQSSSNGQGRGDVLNDADAIEAQDLIFSSSNEAYNLYRLLLNIDESGNPNDAGACLSRELARMVLPTNIYTQFYWKIDLHNLFHFLSLRADPHAQLEIRRYADVICEIVKAWVPAAYNAFEQHRLHSVTFSKSGMSALKRMMAGEDMDAKKAGVSDREWGEITAALAA